MGLAYLFRGWELLVTAFTLSFLLTQCPGAVDSYRLTATVDPPETGTVVYNPGADMFSPGMEVTLDAQPAEGWQFAYWDGPVAATDQAHTTLTMNADTIVIAHFTEIPEPDTLDVVFATDDNGRVTDDVVAAFSDGAGVTLPGATAIATPGGDLERGTLDLVVSRLPVEAYPQREGVDILGGVVATIEGGRYGDTPAFSTLATDTVVDPAYLPGGALLTASAPTETAPPGTEVLWYRTVTDEEKEEAAWIPCGVALVDENGFISFEAMHAGAYAFGVWHFTNDPVLLLADSQQYDCTIEAGAPISGIVVAENSTGVVFAACVFDPAEPPETTAWEAHGAPDEPCLIRLENYGKRCRIRSAYANRFKARYGVQGGGETTGWMNGPYELDANGAPISPALANPYDQCERAFAGPVKLTICARDGNYVSFKSGVVTPLREVFDSDEDIASNVQIDWFTKLKTGYFAQVWVQTPQCTREVLNALPFHAEGNVSSTLEGRRIGLVDRRAGPPYLAVSGSVGGGVGIRFLDPYWELSGGMIKEIYLGGKRMFMFPLLNAEYDPVSDTLWVVHGVGGDAPKIRRYDHPLVNSGDRSADATLLDASKGYFALYLDSPGDRLFVWEANPQLEDAFRWRIFNNASTRTIVEGNPITRVTFETPEDTGEGNYPPYEYIFATGDDLHLLRPYWSNDGYHTPGSGLALYTGSVAEGGGVGFQAWATFGPPPEGPTLRGVYSHANDILYAAPNPMETGFGGMYAVDHPASWVNAWDAPEDRPHAWLPAAAQYRVMHWANEGTAVDVDVVEGDSETLAVLETHNGDLNHPTVSVFENADTASGMQPPIFTTTLEQGSNFLEWVQAPPLPSR